MKSFFALRLGILFQSVEPNMEKMKIIMEGNQQLWNLVSDMKFKDKQMKTRLIKHKKDLTILKY